MSPTLRDVAEQAGVSIGTASQALNNRPNVAPATRARVIDAALALGYPLKERSYTNPDPPITTLGLLTKHDFGLPVEINPFYSCVQLGVESECRRRKINLMFASVEVGPANRPLAWPVMVSEQRVDGLILAGTLIEDAVDFLGRHLDIPVILVDGYAPTLHYDSVIIDNFGGAAKAINLLVRCGHIHIGLVGYNPQAPISVRERRDGYLKALRANGIQTSYIEPSSLSKDAGFEAAVRLLKREPDITAIFACNDMTAIGAVHGLRELGLEVPRDISVVGFDDIDLAGEVMPSLTTVRVHKMWLGSLGVRQLVLRVQNPDQPQVTLTVSTELVVRDSVRQLIV